MSAKTDFSDQNSRFFAPACLSHLRQINFVIFIFIQRFEKNYHFFCARLRHAMQKSLTPIQERSQKTRKQLLYNFIRFYYFSELRTKKDGNAKFFVHVCFDIFFEELSFGNRRQLAKLESIGRRFRIVIDQKFGVTPFLCLNLNWYSIYES